MKFKNLLLGVTLLFSCVVFGQEKGDFSGYVGATYPLSSGADIGANAGVEYMLSDKIGVAPSFSYYFTSGATNYSINVDARYYLGGDDSIKYYGLAGVALRTASVTVPVLGKVSTNDTGFNAGGGAIFSIGESMGFMAQVKYGTSISAIEPMVGLTFNF